MTTAMTATPTSPNHDSGRDKHRRISDGETRIELLLYVAMWAIVFGAPVVIEIFNVSRGSADSFGWGHVVAAWCNTLPFLLLFLIHNFLLLPLLVRRRSRALYAILTAGAIALSVWSLPLFHSLGDTCRPAPPARPERKEKPVRHEVPPHVITFFYIANSVFCLAVVSGNAAVNLYFNSLHHKKRILDLENEHTAAQLQYLKYQINPHFLMNTLNNIHALVDIDSEKARETIVKLSKLMRYMLYDVDHPAVPLKREIDFINNYVELMRIRLTGHVHVSVDLPEVPADVTVPPLLFISFVENAFKHGVSHRGESFVTIAMTVGETTVNFRCLNSLWPAKESAAEHHGIGLKNIRQRLDLLFADRYTLDIERGDNIFAVNLSIPVDNGTD